MKKIIRIRRRIREIFKIFLFLGVMGIFLFPQTIVYGVEFNKTKSIIIGLVLFNISIIMTFLSQKFLKTQRILMPYYTKKRK